MAEIKYTDVTAMCRDLAVLDKYGVAWEAYSAVEPADGFSDAHDVLVVKVIEVRR